MLRSGLVKGRLELGHAGGTPCTAQVSVVLPSLLLLLLCSKLRETGSVPAGLCTQDRCLFVPACLHGNLQTCWYQPAVRRLNRRALQTYRASSALCVQQWHCPEEQRSAMRNRVSK